MRLTCLVALLALLTAGLAQADGCEGFKWNLAREYALYDGAPRPAQAATSAKNAPLLRADALYEVALAPQTRVSYAVAPGKNLPTEGAFGGVVRFTVPADGDYRIGLDASFWIDVIADGKPVTSKDFGGPHGCARPPHKLVQFELKSGILYLLQFSGQTQRSVHVSIVKSEPAKS